MRAVVLFNPRSGRGRGVAAADALCTALRAHGVEPQQLPITAPEREAMECIRGARALVVVGGDGSVSTGAALAARAQTPLAIMPVGTENLAAREFGFSGDVQQTARAVAEGKLAAIDLGEMNGQQFLIMASGGFDAEVVHRLHQARTGAISRLSYAWPALQEGLSWRATDMVVRVDGKTAFSGAGQVVVANMRWYGAGLNPAFDADAQDGLLDVVVLPARTGLDIAKWALRLSRGPWRGGDAFRARGATVDIEWVQPVSLQVDGDPAHAVKAARAQFLVRPNHLQVVTLVGACP